MDGSTTADIDAPLLVLEKDGVERTLQLIRDGGQPRLVLKERRRASTRG